MCVCVYVCTHIYRHERNRKKLLTHVLGNPKSSFLTLKHKVHKGTRFRTKNVFIKDQQCSKDISFILDVPLSNKYSKS